MCGCLEIDARLSAFVHAFCEFPEFGTECSNFVRMIFAHFAAI